MIVDGLLLGELGSTPHAYKLLLRPLLPLRNLVCYLCSGGEKKKTKGSSGDKDKDKAAAVGTAAQVKHQQQLGAQLFALSFLAQGGFLPPATEEERAGVSEELLDPWTADLLDIGLLAQISPDGVAPTEDHLQLARRVLLQYLERHRADLETDSKRLGQIWELGRWPICQDPVLICEAFSFLRFCWQALEARRSEFSVAAVTARTQDLFGMFIRLDFWRLPAKELLSPWVPAQLLSCNVLAQYKEFNLRVEELQRESDQNREEVVELQAQVEQLEKQLEVVDQRSLGNMEKQQRIDENVTQALLKAHRF